MSTTIGTTTATPKSMRNKANDLASNPGKTIDIDRLVRETAQGKAAAIGTTVVQAFGHKQELFAKTCGTYKAACGLDPKERLDAETEEKLRLAVREFWVSCANRILSDFPLNTKARFNQSVCRIDKSGNVETGWAATLRGERMNRDRKEAKFNAVHNLEKAKKRMDFMLDNRAKYDREDFDKQRNVIAALEKHLASFNGKPAKKPAKAPKAPAAPAPEAPKA